MEISEGVFLWIKDKVHTTDEGLNFRTPGPPTVTSMVAAKAIWADANMKSEPRAKCIATKNYVGWKEEKKK